MEILSVYQNVRVQLHSLSYLGPEIMVDVVWIVAAVWMSVMAVMNRLEEQHDCNATLCKAKRWLCVRGSAQGLGVLLPVYNERMKHSGRVYA
jgi:hypothetical protein